MTLAGNRLNVVLVTAVVGPSAKLLVTASPIRRSDGAVVFRPTHTFRHGMNDWKNPEPHATKPPGRVDDVVRVIPVVDLPGSVQPQ